MKKLYLILTLAAMCFACGDDDNNAPGVSPFYDKILGHWEAYMYYDEDIQGYHEDFTCEDYSGSFDYTFDANGNRYDRYPTCEWDTPLQPSAGEFSVEGNVLILRQDGEFGYAKKLTIYEENGDIELKEIWSSDEGDVDGVRIVYREVE